MKIENPVFIGFPCIAFQRKKLFYADTAGQKIGPVMIEHFHPPVKCLLRDGFIKE